MRLYLYAAGLCAAAGMAYADEPRSLPAVGTSLTYQLVTTTTAPTGKFSGGERYTYIVKASDAITAEGIIKPIAWMLSCPAGDDSPGCAAVLKRPGVERDGDMVSVPIPGDIGDSLAKHSGFKYHSLIQELRKFPVPGPGGPGDPEIAAEPAFVVTNTAQCDLAGLAAFLPIGKAPQVTLPCENTFERTASRDGHLPATTTRDTVSLAIAYQGDDHITLPSGGWDVKKLTVTLTPKDPSHPSSRREMAFSEKLGAAVRTHTLGSNPATHAITENIVELIAVSP